MKKERQTSWVRLDNAGKLFAATSNQRDTNVFRFSCELFDMVDPEVLGKALKETLKLFPLYTSTLKRGIFWYYLEESNIIPIIKEEHKPICSRIYDKNKKTLLFKVNYYQRRINLEVHHSLSDGTGAIQFFRVLLDFYLKIKNPEVLLNLPPIDYDASLIEKKADSFDQYYNHRKKDHPKKGVKAYKLHGEKRENVGVIAGHLSVREVLEVAHRENTTLSVFITSLLFQALAETMNEREKKKPIVIAVPVNLRNYFHSASSRNFFGVVNIMYDFRRDPNDLKSIISSVKEQFETELAKEKVEGRMNRMLALEHFPLLRVIPLPLKNFFIKLGSKFSGNSVTVSLSNVSIIKMPPELKQFIRYFDVFIGTGSNHICVCSYEDVLSVSFSSVFISKEVEKNFFRSLTSLGITVEIITDEEDENEILR